VIRACQCFDRNRALELQQRAAVADILIHRDPCFGQCAVEA
jgi:hypothetical protein